MKKINILGQRFGRLTVIKEVFNHPYKKGILWLSRCDCGKEIVTESYPLLSGNTKSCSCLQKDNASKRFKQHGMTETKIYRIWAGILVRCNNKNHKDFQWYGARGIKCLWLSFEDFYRDMGDPPTKQHSIDRVNNNDHYYKENCRWATPSEQGNNQRTNHLVTLNGKTQNITQWSKELGYSRSVIYRMARAKSINIKVKVGKHKQDSKKCENCGHIFFRIRGTYSDKQWLWRRCCSRKCRGIIRSIEIKEHKYWKKGQAIGKSNAALHWRYKQKITKPDQCPRCKRKVPLDLCNVSQEYIDIESDWIYLCRKCHMIQDKRTGLPKVPQISLQE